MEMCLESSEAWEPPQLQEKLSRSERNVPGYSRSNSRSSKISLGMGNPILGMASHDLSNAKTISLGAIPGAIPGIDGNPHMKVLNLPLHSRRILPRIGVVPARQKSV